MPYLMLIPMGLFLVCGWVQGTLTVKGRGRLARICLGLLPLAGLAILLYTIHGYVNATGFDGLAWFFDLWFAGFAFVGTLFGWLAGFLILRGRKKRAEREKNFPW